jgi:transmembrane sensor
MSEVFYYLVSKVLTNEATPSEKEELDQLLRSDEELRQVYEALFARKTEETKEDELAAEQAFAAHAVRLQVEDELEQSKSWQEETIHQVEPGRNTNKFIYWAAAACITAVLALSFFFLIQDSEGSGALNKNEVVTRKGSKSHITLPDGTTVWLNSDSKLIYEGDFQGKNREVVLIGEGYFDVAKDKKRPFIIHTGVMDVKVLGTAFNIRSYPEEKTTETSLIHGSIEVTLKASPEQKIFLKPHDKLIVSNLDQKEMPKDSISIKHTAKVEDELPVFAMEKIRFQKSDSISVEASWVENKLVFDKEPFETAALKMERWYNIKFVIRNESLKTLRFTGDFEHKSLRSVLEALQASRPFHFDIKDETVTIW